MKNFDAWTMFYVLHEMLGFVLWVLLALVMLCAVLFAALLFRENGIMAGRWKQSQAFGLLGGAGALALVTYVSASGLPTAGGPIDWFLILAVFGVGFIGSAIFFYSIAGWLAWLRRRA